MGFLTVLIYIILSLVVGSLLLGLSLEIVNVNALADYLNEVLSDFSLNLSLALIGAILILFCLRYIHAFFHRSRKDKTITFESPQGKVSITLFAIEDMLKKMLEEKSEISHIKPRVLLRKNNVEVNTKGVLTTEVNLVEFTKEIQQNVKEKIHSLLGEDKKVKVNLEIRKLSLGNKSGFRKKKSPKYHLETTNNKGGKHNENRNAHRWRRLPGPEFCYPGCRKAGYL